MDEAKPVRAHVLSSEQEVSLQMAFSAMPLQKLSPELAGWKRVRRGWLEVRVARVGLLATLAAALVPGGSCARDRGVVELGWLFVDADGERLFPQGRLDDTCALESEVAEGGRVRYDLQVELLMTRSECTGGIDDDACLVLSPLRFACDTARGSHLDVPASEQPYLMTVRAVAVRADTGDVCVPDAECVVVPGPRTREVEGGLVTDLQIYEIVLADAGHLLDERECGCG